MEGLNEIDGVTVNGKTGRDSAPHIVSVSIDGVRSEVMLHTLEDRGIYVSAGSACASNKPAVSATLKAIDGNYRIGNSEHFIIEACEYVESFLKFSPKSAIVLNIDNDHLDYFKTFENIKKSFIKFVKLLPKDGILVVNGDDQNCLDLQKYTSAKCITYGISNKNTNFFAVNIVFDENGFPEFDVYHNDKFYARIKLSIPGMHNVSNCLACIAMCNEYEISAEDIQNSLINFTGADRRFQFKGTVNNAKVYDDYGHHPTEIIATAKSLMNKKYNQSWVVFQPHTYSRTKNLLTDFAKALLNFDNIIVLDIYAAREAKNPEISSKDLVEKYPSESVEENSAQVLYGACFDMEKDALGIRENNTPLTDFIDKDGYKLLNIILIMI